MRADGPVVVVDAGESLQPPLGSGDPRELRARQLKAALLLESFADSDAVAFGARDWSLGSSWLLREVASRNVPLVAANLTCDGGRPFPGFRVVERGGRRIGVVGITAGVVDGCTVEPAREAWTRALGEMGPVDAAVLLVPLDAERAIVEVVGDGAGLAAVIDAAGRSGTRRVGAAWGVGAGTRGKHVGVLELAFVEGGTSWAPVGGAGDVEQRVQRLRERLVSLNERVASTPAGEPRAVAYQNQIPKVQADLAAAEAELAAVAAGGAGANQLRWREVALSDEVAAAPSWAAKVDAVKVAAAEGFDPGSRQRVVADAASPYIGGAACAACHPDAERQWAATGHARAYQTLALDNHAADVACVGCHVTGMGQPGGPTDPYTVEGFVDVQCEACHGPGRAHAAAPAAVEMVRVPPVETCRQCHDNDRDEGRFDPASYLPRVAHGGGGAAD